MKQEMINQTNMSDTERSEIADLYNMAKNLNDKWAILMLDSIVEMSLVKK